MPTEVWFRNPDNYIRELVECGEYQIAWDRGYVFKKKIDPYKHAELYYGKSYPFRALVIGDQGTAELRPGRTMENPAAVYPTWCYGEDNSLLEEMISLPAGEDISICSDKSVPADQRPVYGQEHRVVITDIPVLTSGPGRSFIRYLKELQQDYPKAIIHLHGTYSFRIAFGTGFRAADVDPRTSAQKGKIYLPSGKEVLYERAQSNPKWITPMGFLPKDLEVPRNRCMYNIKSAVWAGENYDALFNFRIKNDGKPVDTTTPTEQYQPAQTAGPFTKAVGKPKEGDRFMCNTCSLQNECKYFRDGAVCSVPGAEPVELAKYFQSRDAGLIIDGLGTLLAANTRRLERGMREEDVFGDTNPEVTRQMGQVFDQGIKLAKLVDPSLRGGPSVQVNVDSRTQVAGASPQQLVASAFRALEAQGIPREDITPQMVQDLLSAGPKELGAAVQSTVISEKRD
jgi:hypothetical protein